MGVKILHTGDLHIGMKFNNYPEDVKHQLVEARFETLKGLIKTANDEQCHIFAIAGDLFDKINVPKKDIEKVKSILESFAGDCVLVLPGNHDYDNGMVELWDTFKKQLSDKVVLLNETKVYSLKSHDLDVAIYPAPCDSKHKESNNLGWIREVSERPDATWHIGIAHGALEGLSPDLNKQYFSMNKTELEELPIDLWLLGHTHVPYSDKPSLVGSRIFNAGAPEPDGMDCTHSGHAWLLEIDDAKNIVAKKIDCGSYRFIDTVESIQDSNSFEEIKTKYVKDNADNTLLRLKINGRIDQDLFKEKESIYEEFKGKFACLIIDDTELGVKISKSIIDNEFTPGSFPHQFLSQLSNDGEEDALQLAYELIQEVKAI